MAGKAPFAWVYHLYIVLIAARGLVPSKTAKQQNNKATSVKHISGKDRHVIQKYRDTR